jgi:putative tryptophan/tyrosine transport system substrate-binding protein
MITAVSAAALEHKDLIIKLATQFRLPVVYAYRVFAAHGGPQGRPADLPIQMPTKYDLVINLKWAKAIGLTVR